MDEDLITPKAASAMCHLSRYLLDGLAQGGHITVFRVGKQNQRRYKKSEILKLKERIYGRH